MHLLSSAFTQVNSESSSVRMLRSSRTISSNSSRASVYIATRSESVKEPEDHVAALCEMMAGLIEGTFVEPGDLTTQRQFFNAHIAGWAPRFFEDLEAAKSSRLYTPVGTVGRLFMEIEATAFGMVEV